MVSPNPAARIRSILRWQRGAPTSGTINAALVGSSSRTAARARGRSGCRAAVACRARETIPYGTGPSRLTGVGASCARPQRCRLSLAGEGGGGAGPDGDYWPEGGPAVGTDPLGPAVPHAAQTDETRVAAEVGCEQVPAPRSRGGRSARLVELLELLAYDLRRQRQVLAVALHLGLAFLAQDVSEELLHVRIDRRPGLHAGVEIHLAASDLRTSSSPATCASEGTASSDSSNPMRVSMGQASTKNLAPT